MSCRCGRHNNDKENAPLAQLVEHLTLNQGVQGRFFFCIDTLIKEISHDCDI